VPAEVLAKVLADATAQEPMALARVELGDALTAALRRAILVGDYLPGQRLVESDLAERFGTSRGPVRDALAALQARGLVTTAVRGGAYVTDMLAPDIDELYSLRGALESFALEWAVPRASDEDHARIRSALDALAEVELDGASDELAAADMALHRALVTTACHDRLLSVWESLADQTMLVLRTLPQRRPDIQSSTGQHLALVDAVVARDLPAAQAVLAEHLMAARQALRGGLEDAGTPTP
jgi:DNA-binding GntR family transcriptional regulator